MYSRGKLFRLFGDVRGGMLTTFAMTLPVVCMIGGMAMDLARINQQRMVMQSIADGAALYTVNELAIPGRTDSEILAIAQAYADAQGAKPGRTIHAAVNRDELTVKVTVSEPVMAFFPGVSSADARASVQAMAQLSGSGGNVCLIALRPTGRRAIEMSNNAKMTADSCALYSNSSDTRSVYINNAANIFADTLFAVGGFSGNASGIVNPPVTDAPPIANPLQDRPKPSFGLCDHHDTVITGETELSEGVYCGGLFIDGGEATLDPGTYIIKDGALSVAGGGSLTGEDVGFFLTGENARLDFAADSVLSLSGAQSGPLAGLLVYSDPANPPVSDVLPGTFMFGGHIIRSNNARRLVGTLYLPDDLLLVDGNTPVADQSDYTVIVAKSFELKNGPNLVLRSDYAASEVPVPEGLGPVGERRVMLVE